MSYDWSTNPQQAIHQRQTTVNDMQHAIGHKPPTALPSQAMGSVHNHALIGIQCQASAGRCVLRMLTRDDPFFRYFCDRVQKITSMCRYYLKSTRNMEVQK